MIQLFILLEWFIGLNRPSYFDFPQNQLKIDTLQVIEKVYVHTDRNFYYPGEDIWFKAYLVDATYNLLTDHSNNLHVELVSPEAEIISSRIIRIENGLGNGDFTLLKDLPSGQYQLRAYTNYMRNFGDQLFFFKDIFISDPFEITDPQDSITFAENKISISFFPEGGSLVDNIPSVVAFKAIDLTGKGKDVSGDIYSSDGKFVTSFRSVYKGMGHFVIKPDSGLLYSAIVKTVSRTPINTELPGSFSTGITESIIKDTSDNLVLIIKTNRKTLPLIQDEDLLLTISARNVILKSTYFRINSLNSKIQISSDDLPAGILMFTISSASRMVPLCERLIFNENKKQIQLQIETDRMDYKKRDSVLLKITLRADSAVMEKAFLSFSAAEENSTGQPSQFPTTISSWFLLESDVHGPIEDPSYYFDYSNTDRLKKLNLLLLTQGWRDFQWKYDNEIYLPERGFTISGRLRKKLIDKPVSGSGITIGLIGNESTLFARVITDSTGRFSLPGVDFTGESTVFASAVNDKEELSGEIILDSLEYAQPETMINQQEHGSGVHEKIVSNNHDIIAQKKINKNYKLTDTIVLEEVNVISKKQENFDVQSSKIKRTRLLYGTPDNELIVTPVLENYLNAFEMMTGRIPGVEVYGIGNETKVMIRGPSSINGGTSPLFLIDGVVTSMEEVLNLPVSFIDRIDVLKGSTSIYGVRGGPGVIAVITRDANRITNVRNVFHSIQRKMSGYNEPKIFYSPHHTLESSSVNDPDLRITLFWKPDITLNNNESTILRYFNADNPSTIRMTFEGITSNGIPVCTKAFYTVD